MATRIRLSISIAVAGMSPVSRPITDIVLLFLLRSMKYVDRGSQDPFRCVLDSERGVVPVLRNLFT
jgi:hypothetical protein